MKSKYITSYKNMEITVAKRLDNPFLKAKNGGKIPYVSLTDTSLEVTQSEKKVFLEENIDSPYLLILEEDDWENEGRAKDTIKVGISLAELGNLAGYTDRDQSRGRKLANESVQALVYASEIFENANLRIGVMVDDNGNRNLCGYYIQFPNQIRVAIEG